MGTAAYDFFFGHWAANSSDATRDGPSTAPTPFPTIAASLPIADAAIADAALADRLRHGDMHALEELFHAHAEPLEQYAQRLLGATDPARDVVQDVFVWLWETRDAFAPRTSVRAYLFGAVRHRTLDALRRDRVRHVHANAPELVREMTTVPTPAELVENAEMRDVVATALATLAPRVREVAELRWFGQLSYREIASLLGVSERTVNTQLVAATRTVRVRLERYWRER
jgi:RNA polymerase sigma-70 factor (family 1)